VTDTVSPGGTVPILCTGYDRSGIQSARAEAHGVVDTVFTSTNPDWSQSYLLYGGAIVPPATPAGALVTVGCTMTDIYDHAVTTLDTVVVTLSP